MKRKKEIWLEKGCLAGEKIAKILNLCKKNLVEKLRHPVRILMQAQRSSSHAGRKYEKIQGQ